MSTEIKYIELTIANLSSYDSISDDLNLGTLVPSKLEHLITTINAEDGYVYAAVRGKRIVGTIVSHHEQKMLHNCGVYARVDDFRTSKELDTNEVLLGIMEFAKAKAKEAGCYKLMTTASLDFEEMFKQLGMQSTSSSGSPGKLSNSFEIVGRNIKELKPENIIFPLEDFDYTIIELTPKNIKYFKGLAEPLKRFEESINLTEEMALFALKKIMSNDGHVYVALNVNQKDYREKTDYTILGLINTHFAHRLDGTLISRPENLCVIESHAYHDPLHPGRDIGTYIMQLVKIKSAERGCDEVLFTCKEHLKHHYERNLLFSTEKRSFKVYLEK